MRTLSALAIVLGLSLAACPKTEGGAVTGSASTTSPDPAPPAVTASAAAAATASVAAADPPASASAPPTTASAAPKSSATPASKAIATATAAAAAAVDAGPTCGTKPLPDCPLQSWMKANTAIASASGDLPALAVALDKIAKMTPPGYANWASISKDGATAARAENLDGARASCTGCHKQYRDKYKAEIRTRAVP